MDEMCRSRRENEIQQHRELDGVVFSITVFRKSVTRVSLLGGRLGPLTFPRPPLEGRRDTVTRVHVP